MELNHICDFTVVNPWPHDLKLDREVHILKALEDSVFFRCVVVCIQASS